MISRRHAVQALIAVLFLGISFLPATSHAQTPSQIVINYPELTDVDNALQLGVYFNVADSTGRVTPDAKVKSVRILLDDGTSQDAQVEQPTSPFYIALVLDASGSMSASADAMRQAAIQAINDAPEQARFAVIRFNDKIDVLQDFTEDRNRAINAIGDVKPVNLAGTCLYDAAYQAVQQLGQVPPGRRAIILFTDGKDETAQGNQCSTHSFSDVVQLATRPNLRVPINTIGLSTREQNINVAELRDMANSTGGLSAIGGQAELSDLFTQIMDALKSQWLARVLIYPLHGTHTATLTVTLDDGTMPQPAVVQFEVARDYQVPVTPSPTPTPIVVNLAIQAVTVDQAKNVVNLEVMVQGEQVISTYRFDFFDADTNLLLDSQTVPAPLPDPVTLSAAKLSGKLRVELRALDASGKLITWQGDRNVIDHATYEFSFLRPTETPPPPTGTPIPIAVELNGIAYDQSTDMISLDLSLTGQDQMGSLEISIFDARTNLRVNVYNTEPKESVQLAAKGLEPLHDYTVTVIAQSPTGQNLARSNTEKFTYTPLLTPTPVPTPTFTPTATLAPVKVTIGSIGIDEATDEIVVGILTEDQDRIKSFELQIRDGQTGLVVGNYVHEPPPYDTIRIPLANITAGQYTAILRAFGDNNTLLAEAAPLNFAYSPPPTPTPPPSPTPSPTLTPTPTPGLITRASDAVRDNPALAIVVAVIAFALVVVLFILLRPRKKPRTGTDFLSAQTGFYQFPAAGGAAPAPPKGARPASEETTVQPAGEAEATQVYPDAFPPLAMLTINRSPAATRIGPSVQITSVPFKIGRGTTEANDLSLDEDTSVSRSHAVISYQNGHFFLVDQGSANGTLVDDTRLAPQAPFQLYDGARIALGKGTELTFRMPGGAAPTTGRRPGSEDPDKTDYVKMDDLKQ
jgi:VWFA-related protein